MSKYDPLKQYLIGKPVRIEMTFDEIANLVGGLPASAYGYEAWWNNDDTSHHHCRSWGDAGFDARPNLTRQTVIFHRKN